MFPSIERVLDNPSIDWKSLGLSFLVGNFAIETYVRYRQLKAVKSSISDSIKYEFTKEDFEKSKGYASDSLKFLVVSDAINLIVEATIIKFDVLPWIWSLSRSTSGKLSSAVLINRVFTDNLISQSLIFSNYVTLIGFVYRLPVSYYNSFVIEEKWKFNKFTHSLFLKHKIISLGVTVTLLTLFSYSLLKVAEKFGSSAIPYAIVVTIVFHLLLFTVFPKIMRLFYKIKPLPEGELRTAIESLARKNAFPVSKLYEMNGSSTSSHSNAFFSGLPWSKEITLFDTLIKALSTDEIVAVLAHELGHWKLNHIAQMIFLVQLQATSQFIAFSAFIENKALVSSFGFLTPVSPLISFKLFSYLSRPLSLLNTVSHNLLIRKNEYQADRYAAEQGLEKELATGLIKMHGDSLSITNDDKLYSIFYAEHPSLGERLGALGYVSTKKTSAVEKEKDSPQAEKTG